MTDIKTSPSLLSLTQLNELAEAQNDEAERIAEKLFEITTVQEDHKILTGSIKIDSDDSKETQMYKRILNELFLFSKKNKDSGFAILDRKGVEGGNKKVASLLKAMDGGLFVETFCTVVNEENAARMPSSSISKAQAHRVFEIFKSKLR